MQDVEVDHGEPAELDAVAGDRSLADRLAVLQAWAAGNGAGRPGGGGSQADVTISGTSAFDQLALVYDADGKDHGTGKAYPSPPGHFDDPNACAGY
ncbi:MAG: hypothetical protein KBB39_13685 [Phycicoccus sp.]|nr:hypothetical protein [Phycicoccus sp.]